MIKKFNPCTKCGAEDIYFNLTVSIFSSRWGSQLYCTVGCYACEYTLRKIIILSTRHPVTFFQHEPTEKMINIELAICTKHWNKANPLPGTCNVANCEKHLACIITEEDFSNDMLGLETSRRG